MSDWHLNPCRAAYGAALCTCPADFRAVQHDDAARQAYTTKDSGQRDEFESGAKRDTQQGKPRYDLIPPGPLKRLAELMERGARKYDDNNWMKGMPASRFMASLLRHVEAYRRGERDEDHMAAVVFNAFAIMHFECHPQWDDLTRGGDTHG